MTTTPATAAPPASYGASGSILADFRLERTPFGRLSLSFLNSPTSVEVYAVRAFPIAAPTQGVALVGPDGRERAWIEDLADVPAPMRALVEEDLAVREWVPVITRLVGVSTFSTPSVWQVETDRGVTELVLKGEEDIRRLPSDGLQITSAQGLVFRIHQVSGLDRASRRLLERFL